MAAEERQVHARRSDTWRVARITAAALLAGLLLAGPLSARPDAETGEPTHLVVLGDSLSAGFFLSADQAFPAVLEQALRQRGVAVSVTNAGVSGDTTSGGLARLDRDVPAGTDGIILELGANDKIYHQDPQAARANLQAIVDHLKARRIPILLAGIRFTDGDPLAARYNGVFPGLARANGLAYYPDFYEALTRDPSLRLFDGVHPSAAGVRQMVEDIVPSVIRFLRPQPAERRGTARRAHRR